MRTSATLRSPGCSDQNCFSGDWVWEGFIISSHHSSSLSSVTSSSSLTRSPLLLLLLPPVLRRSRSVIFAPESHRCHRLLIHMIPGHAYGWGRTRLHHPHLTEVYICRFGLQIKHYRAILTSPSSLWHATLIFLHRCSGSIHLITSRSSACTSRHGWLWIFHKMLPSANTNEHSKWQVVFFFTRAGRFLKEERI